MKKEYKVIAISDRRTLVINAGSVDGITEDDSFDIMESDAVELKDPDSGEVYDSIYPKKQRVYVSDVRQKYCVCVSEYTTRTTSTTAFASAMLTPNQVRSKTQRIGSPMHVDDAEVTSMFSYTHGTIHVGDIAMRVDED